MNMHNTPFQEGGIYCNGIYSGSGDPNRCWAFTPKLTALDFDSFTISARFKPSEYYEDTFRPALMGGNSWRWLGIRLEMDSTVTLLYNNATSVRTETTYTPGTWHEGVITYDGTTAILYLDGTEIASEDIVLKHEEDANLSIANGANGKTFKGHFGRLKVYSEVVAP